MARRASRTTFGNRRDSARGSSFEVYGFTIVELLIVIVVIAILATITIVAYNGIQDRAEASAAQAAAKQAHTAITAYSVEHADTYPADITDAGLADDDSTTYQYRVDNSANPPTFCLTTTKNSVSYFVSNSASSPAAGACAGHGVNGVAAITNLAINPSAATSLQYWSTNGGQLSVVRDSAESRTGSATTGSVRANASSSVGGSAQLWDGTATPLVSVTPGDIITISAWMRTAQPGRYMCLEFRWRDASLAQVGSQCSPAITLTSAWVRSSYTATAPAGASLLHVSFSFGNPVSGDSYWIDDLMVSRSNSALTYADGSSPGWIWNGTPNASTSTGPPL